MGADDSARFFFRKPYFSLASASATRIMGALTESQSQEDSMTIAEDLSHIPGAFVWSTHERAFGPMFASREEAERFDYVGALIEEAKEADPDGDEVGVFGNRWEMCEDGTTRRTRPLTLAEAVEGARVVFQHIWPDRGFPLCYEDGRPYVQPKPQPSYAAQVLLHGEPRRRGSFRDTNEGFSW
jgi:hypothetical protein